MKVKASRLSEVVFSWSIFQILPVVRRLVATDKHGPGWALDWLGFEVCFERMVNRGCRLIKWSEATAEERFREYSELEGE